MTRDARAVKTFEKTTTSGFGRVDSAFTKTQRLAAGGFVGGIVAGATIRGIRSVVDAAAESQAVLGQTSVALEATGHSWERYAEQINNAIAAQSKLGFDDEALLRTFSLFVRSTNDVGEALRLNNLAMDVARARFIDLESAALLVNKAALGQAGALRRLGIDVQAGASAQALLTALTQKYGGAAKAAGDDAATSFDRSSVAAENAKEALGQELLPAVTVLNDAFADVANGLVVFIRNLKSLGNIKIPTIEIPWTTKKIGGGTVGPGPSGIDIVKGIIDWVNGPDGMFSTEANNRLAQEFRSNFDKFLQEGWDKATGMPSAFVPKAEVTVPTPKVKGFGEGLTPQDLFGPLIKQIPLRLQEALLDAQHAGKGERAVLVQILETMTAALDDPRLKAKGRIAIKQIIESVTGQIAAIDQATADGVAKGKADAKAKRDQNAADARDAAAAQRAGFDAIIDSLGLQMDKADLTASLADNKKVAAAIEKAILAQIAIEGRTPELLRQLFDVRQQSRQIVADETQTQQFRKLGLGPTGELPIPKRENLVKQFEQLGKVEGLGKQIGTKLANQFALVGKLLRDPTEKLTKETREWIRDFFKTVRGELDSESQKPLMPRHVQISEDILTALGLGKDPDFARIRGAVPKMPTGRLAPPSASTASGGTPVNINGDITVVTSNPDAFLRDLQKTAGRTSGTSRGRFPGRSLGLG